MKTLTKWFAVIAVFSVSCSVKFEKERTELAYEARGHCADRAPALARLAAKIARPFIDEYRDGLFEGRIRGLVEGYPNGYSGVINELEYFLRGIVFQDEADEAKRDKAVAEIHKVWQVANRLCSFGHAIYDEETGPKNSDELARRRQEFDTLKQSVNTMLGYPAKD